MFGIFNDVLFYLHYRNRFFFSFFNYYTNSEVIFSTIHKSIVALPNEITLSFKRIRLLSMKRHIVQHEHRSNTQLGYNLIQQFHRRYMTCVENEDHIAPCCVFRARILCNPILQQDDAIDTCSLIMNTM